MKKVRKHVSAPECRAHLQSEQVVDGKTSFMDIYCPFSASNPDEPDACGNWCALYDEEPASEITGFKAKVTCNGKPIGVLVTGNE